MSRHLSAESLEDGWEGVEDDYQRERATMPVGRHARARAASKTSWRSRQTSHRHSKVHKGMHHRRRHRMSL